MDIKSNMIQLSTCGHIFHKLCINKVIVLNYYSIVSPRCLNCRAFFPKSFIQDTMCYYQPSGSGTEPSEQNNPVNRGVSALSEQQQSVNRSGSALSEQHNF